MESSLIIFDSLCTPFTIQPQCHNRQQAYLVVLFLADKRLEICFNRLVV